MMRGRPTLTPTAASHVETSTFSICQHSLDPKPPKDESGLRLLPGGPARQPKLAPSDSLCNVKAHKDGGRNPFS